MGIPISAGSTILVLLDHLYHLMISMSGGAGGISAGPRGGSEEWLPVKSGLYGSTQLILVDKARDSATNPPHLEGVIHCSVEHSSKRCGCVVSNNKHTSTVAYPFGPPVARTARRALPYNSRNCVSYLFFHVCEIFWRIRFTIWHLPPVVSHFGNDDSRPGRQSLS